MVKAWCDAEKNYLEEHPHVASVKRYGNAYALFAHDVFFGDYDTFQAANTSLFGAEDWKQRLEDYFKIEL